MYMSPRLYTSGHTLQPANEQHPKPTFQLANIMFQVQVFTCLVWLDAIVGMQS